MTYVSFSFFFFPLFFGTTTQRTCLQFLYNACILRGHRAEPPSRRFSLLAARPPTAVPGRATDYAVMYIDFIPTKNADLILLPVPGLGPPGVPQVISPLHPPFCIAVPWATVFVFSLQVHKSPPPPNSSKRMGRGGKKREKKLHVRTLRDFVPGPPALAAWAYSNGLEYSRRYSWHTWGIGPVGRPVRPASLKPA